MQNLDIRRLKGYYDDGPRNDRECRIQEDRMRKRYTLALFIGFLAIGLALSFSSCSKDSGDDVDGDIVGTWSAALGLATYTFNSNGSFTASFMSIPASGDFTTKDQVLTMNTKSPGQGTNVFQYSFRADKKTLTLVENGSKTTVLTRS
jgi:hypothetical protein